MAKELQAGHAAIWAQPHGPNTQPQYLGCHMIEGFEKELGELTLRYCPGDENGEFKVSGSHMGEPGVPSFTVDAPMKDIEDILEFLSQPMTIFLHKSSYGKRNLFTNWERSFIFTMASKKSEAGSKLSSLAAADEDRSMHSFAMNSEEVHRLFRIVGSRISDVGTAHFLGVDFCTVPYATDKYGQQRMVNGYGIAFGEGAAAAKGIQRYTDDGGATWTAAAAGPFAVDEDISAGVVFPYSSTTVRQLVARGTTDGANPAEIGISDDHGAVWTLVDVGAVDGQYVAHNKAICVVDRYHIWLACDDGYVYFSEDGGASWTLQDAGIATTSQINMLRMASELVGYAAGDGNEMIRTINGYAWSAVTLPVAKAGANVTALSVIDEDRLWIGYDDGDVYYSGDMGVTWTERTLGLPAGAISDIEFWSPTTGVILFETAAPVASLYRTIDGGYTWEAVTIPTNDGLNGLCMQGLNSLFAVGNVEAVSATSMLMKVEN